MVFIESKSFTRWLEALAGTAAADVLRKIQDDLVADPGRGDIVRGLSGVRKARVSNPRRGKGKRGGFRYLYVYLETQEHIHLLFLLDKDEQEDLDQEQRGLINELVRKLKG